MAVVTIDGPSGSGKGTVSRLLARRTGWHLLDSGALYRLVALAGRLAGLPTDDADAHAELARQIHAGLETDTHGQERILLDSRDVTAQVRSEDSGAGASRVAAWPVVRAALLERQRAFVRPPGLIADGRERKRFGDRLERGLRDRDADHAERGSRTCGAPLKGSPSFRPYRFRTAAINAAQPTRLIHCHI